MPGTGTATIDFGTGASTATASVLVPTITADEKVEAWIVPADSADNTADNHWVEDLTFIAGPAEEGVGFTVYGKCNTLLAHGVYNFNYVYA
jgi:hypothetical protein